MKSQVYSNMCNCIDLNNINHLFNPRIEFLNEAKICIKLHQFSKNWRLLAVAFVLRQGFPSVGLHGRKGGFPSLLIGWEFSSCWSDFLGSQWLGVGWWWFQLLVEVWSGFSRTGLCGKLNFWTRNSTERKETKIKEYTDVKRLGGISSHHGVSWRAGRSTLEWHSKNAESDDKKHG